VKSNAAFANFIVISFLLASQAALIASGRLKPGIFTAFLICIYTTQTARIRHTRERGYLLGLYSSTPESG
jgi:hypothetical protein